MDIRHTLASLTASALGAAVVPDLEADQASETSTSDYPFPSIWKRLRVLCSAIELAWTWFKLIQEQSLGGICQGN